MFSRKYHKLATSCMWITFSPNILKITIFAPKQKLTSPKFNHDQSHGWKHWNWHHLPSNYPHFPTRQLKAYVVTFIKQTDTLFTDETIFLRWEETPNCFNKMYIFHILQDYLPTDLISNGLFQPKYFQVIYLNYFLIQTNWKKNSNLSV